MTPSPDQERADGGGNRPAAAHRGRRRDRELLGLARPQAAPGENDRADAEGKARAFAIEAARVLHDDKCSDVLVLDLRGKSQITDFLVIGSGTSDRQMKSTGEDVAELGEQQGFPAAHHNLREHRADWRVLDLVDVIVHIFEPNTRAFYDLEMMWGDAPDIEWARPGDTPRRGGAFSSDEGE
ncbi:MAG: ribosome silencing factor [Phycisphaerales bacterium]|nr:ribosome silencing factor [Phycisphaerales bacterium]